MKRGGTAVEPDYTWQDQAVEKWFCNHCRGIVEAVTGTGKTFLGIKAIRRCMTNAKKRGHHFYPVIVVPTGVLQRQWQERLLAEFEGEDVRIGLLGQGHKDRFFPSDVIVAVVNSLVRHGPDLLDFLHRAHRADSLLLADEVHRYLDAPVFRTILDLPFRCYLGLTPRMPRGQAHIPYASIPKFGKVIDELDMRRARRLGLIPPFHLLNIPVELTAAEGIDYAEASDLIAKLKKKLKEVIPRPYLDQDGNLDLDLLKQYLRILPEFNADRKLITGFFVACYKRASIYYMGENKLEVLREAIKILSPYGGRVLVFFERIYSADVAGDLLEMDHDADFRQQLETRDNGFPWCRVLHSETPAEEREQIIKEFGEPGNRILIACRSLDEGFDIPGVDIAILAASTQSPLQRIQRIGRVLRRYNSEKRSIILTLYSPGTGDANIVANDAEMFPGNTDVFMCSSGDWAGKFRALLEYYARPKKQ